MKEERELIASISSSDWVNLPRHVKWRALAWLVDTVSESESMRSHFQSMVDAMTTKPDKKVATGWDLYLQSKGGAEANYGGWINQEWTRLAEAGQAEWNEKAKVLEKEQREKVRLEAEGKDEKFTAALRNEPFGVDRESRRYWILRRGPSDWILTVEVRAALSEMLVLQHERCQDRGHLTNWLLQQSMPHWGALPAERAAALAATLRKLVEHGDGNVRAAAEVAVAKIPN